jgi:HEAT repeat protein
MNDSSLFPNQPQKIESRPPLGEDLLPPVEQPSARFIIQLFVVPALIVMLIVAVWLSFNWLVRSTQLGPDKLIQGIEDGPSVARWQRARELADLLHDKRYPQFRQSQDSAAHLARILDREIEQGDMKDDDIEYRKYLAGALGEFDVQEGTDVLLKAAQTNRDPNEQRVRDAAIQAIAVRAYNLQRLSPPVELANPELESNLNQLATDTDPRIRFQTAYALGQLGTPAAIERLEAMVNDLDSDTRYNAAVALAHRGNAKAIDTLVEMLDVDELAGVREEKNEEGKKFKRTVIVVSAIDAAHSLARKNAKADIKPVIDALKKIVDADPQTLDKAQISKRVVSDAKQAINLLTAQK